MLLIIIVSDSIISNAYIYIYIYIYICTCVYVCLCMIDILHKTFPFKDIGESIRRY